MMKKTMLPIALACLCAVTALYAMQTENAPSPQIADSTSASEVVVLPSATFPAPHEPFDRTAITPYETVGASHFLPF